MASTAPIRLTKPRVAGVILEATAATISLVLVLWLLLWFITRVGPKDRIEAYYVPYEPASNPGVLSEEVAYQANDVRRLRGAGPSDETPGLRPGEMVDEVVKKVRSGSGPVVIYVSAPVVDRGSDADESVRRLIEAVAKESTRDVVLALDIAQVDSDRDLGVFGNSPYGRVEKAVQSVPDAMRGRLVVMTSAAAAQKSWSSEALGQSIFAYYLAEGLAGGAKGWSGARADAITVEGLYQYVFEHVRWWARTHRESEQTPMLLAAGPDGDRARKLGLRAIPRHAQEAAGAGREAAAPESTKGPAPGEAKGEEKKKGTENAAPAVLKTEVPPPSLEDQLSEEWKHQEKLRSERHPYREFPVSWKKYQDAMLRAERVLRISRGDDRSVREHRFGEALSMVRERRKELEQALDSRASAGVTFPFRPLKGSPDGAKRLVDALKVLKIDPPTWLDLPPAPQSTEKARTDRDKGAPATGADGASPAFPPEFGARPGEITPPFLELQLPTWAYQFTTAFRCDGYFADRGRADLLLRLVELRRDAELALHTDPRGLPWIKPVVAEGDRVRRTLQDRLFGMPKGPLTEEQQSDLHRVKAAYDDASQFIGKYREARETFEASAYDLPYYAEWAIRMAALDAGKLRTQGSVPSALPESPLPASVGEALDALGALARALRPPRPEAPATATPSAEWLSRPVGALEEATQRLGESMQKIEQQFTLSCERLGADQRPDWVELDAALRVPLIPAARRKALVQRLLVLDESVDTPALRARDVEASREEARLDRGFWVRAAGFARLDLDLRRLGLPPSADEEDPDRVAIRDLWGAIRSSGDPGGQSALRLVPGINEAARKSREKARSQLLDTPRARDRDQAELALREADCRIRCLAGGESEGLPAADLEKSVADYRRLGECLCLDFHLERLQADHAADRSLAWLAREIESREKELDLRAAVRPAGSVRGLTLGVIPPGGRAEVGEDLKTQFTVSLDAPGEKTDGDRPLPEGLAFLGLAGMAEGLIVDGQGASDVPGFSVPVPLAERPSRREFRLTQTGRDVKLPAGAEVANLDARIFYRGRHDLASPSPMRVAVRPYRIDDPVQIHVSQDGDRLKAKYPGYDRQIEDQFVKHPGEGYLRRGRDLDYVLKVVNRLPTPMTLSYRIVLARDAKGPEEVLKKGDRVFPPRQPVEIWKDTIRAESVAEGRRPRLRVELAEGGKPLKMSEVVFAEAQFSQYIELESRYGFFDPKKEQRRPGEHFIVTMRRRVDDPVTEPIPTTDMRCTMSPPGNTYVYSARDDDNGDPWIWPGREFKFYQPVLPSQRQVKWHVEVGEDRQKEQQN